MKVVNLCSSDWANFSHDNACALRSVGVDCEDYALNAHKFNYKSQSTLTKLANMRVIAAGADVVQVFHSDLVVLETVKQVSDKLVVYHTGSGYRSQPEKHNAAFNRHVKLSVIALPEFAGLGSKNERYLVGAVDVPELTKIKVSNPPVFVHYPSNETVKGSDQILAMIYSDAVGEVDLRWSFDKVSHDKQRQRMQIADVVIELFKPLLEGKPYGSFGITALEASAMGKIVVTQCLSEKVYTDVYGECELMLTNTPESFVETINNLLSMTSKEILRKRIETYEWVRDNHSYKATGERLKTMLNEL